MKETICFAGGGRMAGAMIRGLLASGADPSCIRVADTDETVRAEWSRILARENIAPDVRELSATEPVILVLAVKPQQMDEVLRAAGSGSWRTVISIAAGVTLARLEKSFPAGTPVVRAMPNTPALVGKGITVLAAGACADEDSMMLAERVLAAVGDVVRMDERHLDAVTAISGSGPAYFFLMMKELVRCAEEMGIEPGTARRLVLKTASGAAELAMAQDVPLSEMIAAVASKGGTTERALAVFAEKGLGEIITGATGAAYKRSMELGR
ncbi:MAG: pyrroline-5-carboxylate reductase [Candidatus Hydrogenedentota bacterium]